VPALVSVEGGFERRIGRPARFSAEPSARPGQRSAPCGQDRGGPVRPASPADAGHGHGEGHRAGCRL